MALSFEKSQAFPDLLRLIDRIAGLQRVRFMSPHPYYLDERMIAAMAECRTVCGHLHMPLQSGSDRILRSMRRNYTVEGFLKRIDRLKEVLPSIVLSTDIIVGFPTETDEDFERTLEVLEGLAPSWTYAFKYSPRESTESADRKDDVVRSMKESRLARLNELVDRLTQKALDAWVGFDVEVLAEDETFGRTREGFKVRWDDPVAIGSLTRLRVHGTTRRTLLGEIHEQ